MIFSISAIARDIGSHFPIVPIKFGIFSNGKNTPERKIIGIAKTSAESRDMFSDFDIAPIKSPIETKLIDVMRMIKISSMFKGM